MKLIQVDNINCYSSFPLATNKSPEELRNIYGSQIENETVKCSLWLDRKESRCI